MTFMGATLEFEERAVVALVGAGAECKLEAASMPAGAVVEVPAGSTLECGTMNSGIRSYLAVQGGFDVRLVMGSASTNVGGEFGGIDGRKLKKGDLLRVKAHSGLQSRRLRPGTLDLFVTEGPIRVTRGSQHDWFGPEAFDTFTSSPYQVAEQSNRNGLRLQGEPIRPLKQSQLLTDGIPFGGIQVPQDGQPIVLFVDQQTTGGYPKIATVISADISRVAQLGPHDQVHFAVISIPEALQLLREQEQHFRGIFL
jgi:antagonist of KipI